MAWARGDARRPQPGRVEALACAKAAHKCVVGQRGRGLDIRWRGLIRTGMGLQHRGRYDSNDWLRILCLRANAQTAYNNTSCCNIMSRSCSWTGPGQHYLMLLLRDVIESRAEGSCSRVLFWIRAGKAPAYATTAIAATSGEDVLTWTRGAPFGGVGRRSSTGRLFRTARTTTHRFPDGRSQVRLCLQWRVVWSLSAPQRTAIGRTSFLRSASGLG